MVMHFGELYHGMRGIITHRLSPYEQDMFAGMFGKGTANVVRRSCESAPFWIPPFALAFVVTYLLEARHLQLQKKNPNDYKDDE